LRGQRVMRDEERKQELIGKASHHEAEGATPPEDFSCKYVAIELAGTDASALEPQAQSETTESI
jgi:hypothetical protein